MKIRLLAALCAVFTFMASVYASDGTASSSDDEKEMGPTLPSSHYWRHDPTTNRTTINPFTVPEWNVRGGSDGEKFGPVAVRSMKWDRRPDKDDLYRDDDHVVEIYQDPRVGEKFASIPSNEGVIRGRCDTIFRGKQLSAPPQAAIFFTIPGDGDDTETVIGMARFGQDSAGASVPAVLLKPAYWKKGVSQNLLKHTTAAELLAEVYMIGSGLMSVPGFVGNPSVMQEQFQFFGHALTKHPGTAQPLNGSLGVLAANFRPASPQVIGAICVPEKDWYEPLKARFDELLKTSLRKIRSTQSTLLGMINPQRLSSPFLTLQRSMANVLTT